MSDVQVLSEPFTYRPDIARSYFKDLVDAERGDFAAKERLERHAREVQDELERRDQRAHVEKPSDVEFRANPDRTAGQGGNFAPPLWAIEHFAGVPRARRVLAGLIPTFALPQGVQSVNIPRLTTGNTEAITNDLAVDPSTDAIDTSVTSPVAAISGHGDVSLQALDQSPAGAHLDWAFLRDLTEAYDAQLEAQLINGSGVNGQLSGLLTTATSNQAITYTSATPTATGMVPSLGQIVAKVGNNRKLPPESWLMTTSRLAWIASGEDSQNRPLLLTDREETGQVDLLAFPVALDDAIPTTLGTGGNQDTIIACRPSDMLLFEGTPHARVLFEPGSGELQARIQLYGYVAALVGRYPSGTAYLTGSGTVIQSGF